MKSSRKVEDEGVMVMSWDELVDDDCCDDGSSIGVSRFKEPDNWVWEEHWSSVDDGWVDNDEETCRAEENTGGKDDDASWVEEGTAVSIDEDGDKEIVDDPIVDDKDEVDCTNEEAGEKEDVVDVADMGTVFGEPEGVDALSEVWRSLRQRLPIKTP